MKQPKHSKEAGKVYMTADYKIFKPYRGNRPIRQDRVKLIAKSMREKGFNPNRPINVTTTLEVLDGHHRLEAAKLAKVPVYYMVDTTPGTVFEKMMSLNEMVFPWQKMDSIPGLVEKKYASYVTLKNFQNQYPDFKLTEQLMMLSNSTNDVDKLKFTRGLWKHSDEKVGRKWASDIMKLKPYFKEGYNKSIFVRAMIDIFIKHPEFNFEEFLHRVKMRQEMIHMCGTKDSYKEMIENIYNYRRNKSEKINLRF